MQLKVTVIKNIIITSSVNFRDTIKFTGLWQVSNIFIYLFNYNLSVLTPKTLCCQHSSKNYMLVDLPLKHPLCKIAWCNNHCSEQHWSQIFFILKYNIFPPEYNIDFLILAMFFAWISHPVLHWQWPQLPLISLSPQGSQCHLLLILFISHPQAFHQICCH